jgi:FlaA1/EpsC-like NDP-sugar epimerase
MKFKDFVFADYERHAINKAKAQDQNVFGITVYISDTCILKAARAFLVFKALEESNGGETFISKIPSFHIGDLANAMLPNARLKEIGIREGEKLHEVMVTKDDSRSTYEFNKHYIVYPHFEWWDSSKNIRRGGKPVDEGFEYNSESNNEWLSVNQIREALKTI